MAEEEDGSTLPRPTIPGCVTEEAEEAAADERERGEPRLLERFRPDAVFGRSMLANLSVKLLPPTVLLLIIISPPPPPPPPPPPLSLLLLPVLLPVAAALFGRKAVFFFILFFFVPFTAARLKVEGEDLLLSISEIAVVAPVAAFFLVPLCRDMRVGCLELFVVVVFVVVFLIFLVDFLTEDPRGSRLLRE